MIPDMTTDALTDAPALERAIAIAGSQTALAEKIREVLGPDSTFSQQTISYWRTNRSGEVPADYCPVIEIALDGRVTRRDLRPDLFGPLQAEKV